MIIVVRSPGAFVVDRVDRRKLMIAADGKPLLRL
jgi:hypothetical protein